jgi:hypothetical protein
VNNRLVTLGAVNHMLRDGRVCICCFRPAPGDPKAYGTSRSAVGSAKSSVIPDAHYARTWRRARPPARHPNHPGRERRGGGKLLRRRRVLRAGRRRGRAAGEPKGGERGPELTTRCAQGLLLRARDLRRPVPRGSGSSVGGAQGGREELHMIRPLRSTSPLRSRAQFRGRS